MADQGARLTVPPPGPDSLASALDRNIAALQERRAKEAAEASRQEKFAGVITRFAGSMGFVYFHLVVFSAWVLCNVGLVPAVHPWDPTLVILATEASVEAIFLSTFVLISQNRAAAAADQRADLDLQINLLAEHEITRLLSLTRAIAGKLGVSEAGAPELAELTKDVAPEAVLNKLQEGTPDPEDL